MNRLRKVELVGVEAAIADHQAVMCRLAKSVAVLLAQRRRALLVAVPRRVRLAAEVKP